MLKSFLVTGVMLYCLTALYSQNPNTDNLWRVFQTTKNDSLKLDAFVKLRVYYNGLGIDTVFYFSQKMLQICNAQPDPRYHALAFLGCAYAFYSTSDYTKAQEWANKAVRIAEKTQDPEVWSLIENNRYLLEVADPAKAIVHMRKSFLYKNNIGKTDLALTNILANFATAFIKNNQIDSAFFYAQKMYELSYKVNDTLNSYKTTILGDVYLKMNQLDIAFAFYKKGIIIAEQKPTSRNLRWAYTKMGDYYSNINRPDSALYYWKKIFVLGPGDAVMQKFSNSRKIADYYYSKGMNDSAAKYMNYYIIANDSLNSAAKLTKLQAAKFEEEVNQQEQAKAQQEETEARNHNIQLSFIAIGILTVVILFLLLSNSFIISHRLVGFLSVLVLLVVFEFINLLIHPFLEKITHHSPLLMLLGLVAIAALIIPLHHKLEHWATHKLVEKNKAIRLAKAKKTIEELEANQNNKL